MLTKLKRIIRRRITRHYDVPEIPLGLERLSRRNFFPAHIFDVGAYSGEFSKECRRIWPHARLSCFEVLPHRVEELKTWCAADGNAEIVQSLLGAEVKEAVPFYEMETASSVLREHVTQAAPARSYPMTTLDEFAATSDVRSPVLLKLDTQGYEFEILNGAQRTLPSIDVILAELNFIDIHSGVHLLDDTIAFLRDNNFVAYDICGLHRRPLDSALWQADFIFVPNDSYLRADKRWRV